MRNPGVVPIVLAHARALLTSTREGRTAYLDADLRDVETILDSAELRDTLDLSRPVALSLIAILHFFPDADDPHGILRRLLEHLPSGSYVAITNATPDFAPQELERVTEIYRKQGIPCQVRTRAEFTRFFDGLDLVDPGVTSVHRWRPDTDAATDITDAQVSVYGPSPAHTDALRGVAAQHAIRGFRVLPVSYPSPSSPAPGCASGPTAAPDTVNLTDYGGLRPADLLRKAGGTPNPPQGNQTHLETDP